MALGGKGRSLLRGLVILDFLLERRSITVAEIISELRIARATAFALVRGLEQHGYLERDAENPHGYTFGRQLYRLGAAYESGSRLLEQGRVVLSRLAREIGEMVQLSVLDREMNLVVWREQGENRIRMMFRVGTRTPINWSASGTLLVSDLSDEELHIRLAGRIPASPTGLAPTRMDAVIREIRRSRRLGYALKVGHAHQHIVTIAAPVLDRSGRCVAAITVAAYEPTVTLARRRLLIACVRQGAKELAGRLENPPSRPRILTDSVSLTPSTPPRDPPGRGKGRPHNPDHGRRSATASRTRRGPRSGEQRLADA